MNNKIKLKKELMSNIEGIIHSFIINYSFQSDLDKIRTCNRLIRSQVHYPVMLRGHFKN